MKKTAPRNAAAEPGKRLGSEGRTALGKRLRAIRQKLISAGEPLLDWDGIDKEIAERRGES